MDHRQRTRLVFIRPVTNSHLQRKVAPVISAIRTHIVRMLSFGLRFDILKHQVVFSAEVLLYCIKSLNIIQINSKVIEFPQI